MKTVELLKKKEQELQDIRSRLRRGCDKDEQECLTGAIMELVEEINNLYKLPEMKLKTAL